MIDMMDTLTTDSLSTAKQTICSALIDTMGGYGETFVARVQNAQQIQEIKELLVSIASVVEAFGGKTALRAFFLRVGKI
jgi:hypothetical protein